MMPVQETIRGGQAWHPMMGRATHDEESRELFVQSFIHQLNGNMSDGNKALWEYAVGPAFRERTGRDPKHVSEIRRALLQQPFTRYWSAMKRCTKEMQWDVVGSITERQLDTLVTRAATYRTSSERLGRLELDPSLAIPRYLSEVENHAQPGGYHTELTEDDLFAGAEYDRTFFIGQSPSLLEVAKDAGTTGGHRRPSAYGPYLDDMGAALAAWLRRTAPDFAPTRILEMGCTIGHSTLPWVDAYPDAEVHAIDVAAPCLRYAHARAEALGKRAFFSQQDAEATRFVDESFDVVVSHLLIHELTTKSLRTIFRECHRLLRSGGYMLHLDLPPVASLDTMSQLFPLDWNTHFNAEPFITKLVETDLADVAAGCGFDRHNAFSAYAPSEVPGSQAKRHFFGVTK